MRLRILAGLAGLLFLLPTAAEAGPSFSCKHSNLTLDEYAICNDSYLSQLDVEMAYLWRKLNSRQKAILRNNQRRWIWYRQQCGANYNCLETFYTTRIDQLRDVLGY